MRKLLEGITNSNTRPYLKEIKSLTGLHDTLYEGQFKWFDGLRFKHGVCVPVHANGGHLENCVAWSIARPEGCWEDRRCNEKIPYTCRIPVEGNKNSSGASISKKSSRNIMTKLS